MKKILISVAMVSLLAGCGHIANQMMSDDALLDKAEFALGINKNRLKLLERSGSIESVDYKVRTSNDQVYRCYFTTAGVTSDAVCKRIGGKATSQTKKDDSCNMLLRAAGRC